MSQRAPHLTLPLCGSTTTVRRKIKLQVGNTDPLAINSHYSYVGHADLRSQPVTLAVVTRLHQRTTPLETHYRARVHLEILKCYDSDFNASETKQTSREVQCVYSTSQPENPAQADTVQTVTI